MKFFAFAILSVVLTINFCNGQDAGDMQLIETAMQVCAEKQILPDQCLTSFKDAQKDEEKCLSHEVMKKMQAVEDGDCKIKEEQLKNLSEDKKKTLIECNKPVQDGEKCKACAETSQCVLQKEEQKKK